MVVAAVVAFVVVAAVVVVVVVWLVFGEAAHCSYKNTCTYN